MTQTNQIQPEFQTQPQIKVPDTKPKYQQFTGFWLPILTPLLNFGLILIAAKYPGIAEAVKKSGLDNAIITMIAGSTITSAATIVMEKHKDGKILSALAVNQGFNQIQNSQQLNNQEIINAVDDVNEEYHYRDNENAG